MPDMRQVNREATEQRLALSKTTLEGTLKSAESLNEAIKNNQQAANIDRMDDAAEENSVRGITKKTSKLEKSHSQKTTKAKRAQESVLVRKDDADGLADQFSRRQGNREYHLDATRLSQLVAEDLGAGINENSQPDEIIAIIRRRLTTDGQTPDVAIVDKAFEFLLEVGSIKLQQSTGVDKTRIEKINKKIELAKGRHFEANAIEIQVAQKIIGAVDAVVQKTGQTVKETLDRYRDVVHNPPDLQSLRKYYETKGFQAMVLELKGLSSYLGGNFKRFNLENAELAQLAAAAKKMQALLNVFRQTQSQVSVISIYLKTKGKLT